MRGADDILGPKIDPRYLRAVEEQNAKPPLPPFVDGSRVTPGTEGCKCDGPCPHCGGRGCEACDKGTRICEFPCWQRLGMTSEPCCSDCAPLDEPAPIPVAEVVPLSASNPEGQ